MKKCNVCKKIFSIVLIVVLVMLSAVAIKFFTGYKVYRNVNYGDSEYKVMDVYIPKRAKKRENNGCVLFIHGGSWSGGDKAEE